MNESDKFIIIASDGLWEFITNSQVIIEKVVEIVKPFWLKNDPESACNELVEEAKKAWESDNCSRDDITCALLFLNLESKNISSML